ncbi:MAG: MFS transporter [Deltaproteobacteria bacterium]|nr:MFS transporter [Deltaproteobacteria bacterium]
MTQRTRFDVNDIFYGWWNVAGGFVLLFLYAGAGFYSFSIFINPLEDAFGWSRAAISLTMSIYMIVHGVCAPLIGHMIRVYGPKRVMTIAAALSGICFISVSFTPSLWYFYAAYALLAVATTGIGFIPVSEILSRWFVKRRGTAIGFAMVGISFGGFIMAPLVAEIIGRFGWRYSFVFLGVLVWVLGFPVTLFVMKGDPADMGLLPDGKKNTSTPDEHSGRSADSSFPGHAAEGWPFKAAIRSRAFFFLALTFFFASLAQMGVLQHQVPMILDIGISKAAAATALGLTAGLGGVGKLAFGRLSEVLPFKYAPVLCFGLQALGILILLNAESLTVVWVYVFLFGFAMGGVIVLLPLVVGHFFGLSSFGVIMGTLSFLQAMGASSGVLVSGLVYDAFGSYRFALMSYVCFSLVAVVSILLTGKPKPYVKRISSQGH